MQKYNRVVKTSLLAILVLSSLELTACWPIKPDAVIVLPESKVQQMSKGESATFDGYLISAGGLAKLLEKAESCIIK